MGKRYLVNAGLDYVQGHLRYGHLEGTVELTDEELAKLKKDPNFAKELDLETRVDDWRVDDVGAVDSLAVFELDDAGNKKEVDMTEDRSLGMEYDCYDEDFAKTDNSNFAVGIADKMFRFEVKDAPEQGTDKWLDWRKQGITATEAGMIMFPDSHASPMTVYSEKLGLTVRDQSDPDGYMHWGHIIENDLVHEFMNNHPTFTDCTQGRLYQRDWAKCSLDAQCFDENGVPVIIECKTGQNEAKWNPIPNKYYAQVQWQMYVTGMRTAYFAVLIRGHQYFEKKVEYNPAFVERMLHRCFVVWDCIQNKQPPARLGIYAADKDAIAAMAGVSGHSGPAISVDAETIAKFKELKERAEKADEEFQAFKNELGYKMVDASRLLTPDGKSFASWVERKGTTGVDKKLLQTKYPDVYNECMKTGMPSRYVKYNV